MSFQYIDQVVPFFDMAHDRGITIDANFPRTSPRLFKTHLGHEKICWSPAARYIYVIRNPRDVVVSFFRFLQSFVFEHGDDFFPEFFDHIFMVPHSAGHLRWYFSHVRGWLEHRDDLNVLILTYEDLCADRMLGLQRIARFLSTTGRSFPIDPADPVFAMALERSSFGFMKAHEQQFARQSNALYPREGSKVRSGRGAEGEALVTEEQQQRINRELSRSLSGLFGCDQVTYDDVCVWVRQAFQRSEVDGRRT